MRLKVSRQEMPASTKMRVQLLATMAQLPRLPLAKSETDTLIGSQHTCKAAEPGVTFWLSKTFG